jgi:AcrR family transcriptional regulator
MESTPTSGEGLRERKKKRTRRALVEAALRLFDERGYDETTIADITTAADVSTRTFFSYFRSKDDVLFADTDERLELLWAGLAERAPDERPVDALRRIARELLPRTADELIGVNRDERTKILLSRPSLQARGTERLVEAQHQMAAKLCAAFPDDLSPPQAAAVTGALVAVALQGMRSGDSFERIGAKLEWTLDLMGDSLERYQEPPVG